MLLTNLNCVMNYRKEKIKQLLDLHRGKLSLRQLQNEQVPEIWIKKDDTYHKQGSKEIISEQQFNLYVKTNNATTIVLPDNGR